MTATVQTHGAAYVIGAAIVQALRDAPSLAGAKVMDNPERATDLADGGRVIFVEDQLDRPRDGAPQPVQRTYQFAIGVIRRGGQARADAHADWRAVRALLRTTCMPAITRAGVRIDGLGLREGEVRFRLENIDVGGSLVLGLFTLDYRDQG